MWPILAGLGVGAGLWGLRNWLFNDPLQRELQRVALQGTLSPAERNLFYRQLRDQVLSTAGVANRMGQAVAGARGLSDTGLTTALARDIASGAGAQAGQIMSDIEKQVIASRLQGLGLWNQYQQYLMQTLAQAIGGLGQTVGTTIGAML